MRIFSILLAGALVLFGSEASAQSSLGITGATLSFGAIEDEFSVLQGAGRATLDVAVTSAHGLQGDLAFEDSAYGTIGRLNGHLYMDPVSGQKYGLFLAMSDLDGRSLNWVDFGAEGQLNIGDTALASIRAGLGRTDADSLDYIFGGLGLALEVSPSVDIEITLDVAEFDEAKFRALSIETGLVATYAPGGQPWGLYGEILYSDLAGRDGAAGEFRLGAGIRVMLGNSGGIDASTRHFRDHDPVASLFRRGL